MSRGKLAETIRREKRRLRASRPRNSIPAPSEHQEQVAIFAWRDMAAKGNSDLAMLISTQPGLRTSMGAAVKAKKAGMPKGFPDLFLAVPRVQFGYRSFQDLQMHGLFVELKRRDAPPSALKPEQAEWGRRLEAQGYAWRVARGAKEAIDIISRYLEGEL